MLALRTMAGDALKYDVNENTKKMQPKQDFDDIFACVWVCTTMVITIMQNPRTVVTAIKINILI